MGLSRRKPYLERCSPGGQSDLSNRSGFCSTRAFSPVGSGLPLSHVDLEGIVMPAAARHRGFHRKPRGARRERGFRTPSGGVAARPVRAMAAMAGAALVAASVVVGTPVASAAGASPSEIRVVRSDVLLAAAPSLLNVPVNLVRDVINIPYAEIQAVDLLARAQMFSGPWFVVSATNIWGVDPGDPPRLRAITAMLVPFPALSGLYLNQNDQRGLGQ